MTSDTIRRIFTAEKKNGSVVQVAAATGTILSIIEHGYQLMQATGVCRVVGEA